MKQNKYDQSDFFAAYSQMDRSTKGLEGAGEWHILKRMLPDFQDKKVLDLGCGFGWHCRYASNQGASTVLGIDISEKMIQKARELTDDSQISYQQLAIEDFDFIGKSFDIVLSSLAFHYIKSFKAICENVYSVLPEGGHFIFSVEHPIFTARTEQDWYYDNQGNPLHWPVDCYHEENQRETTFLNEEMVKYHRTLSTYLKDLITTGFKITAVEESYASAEMMEEIPVMEHENRRPMFLLVSAVK